MGDSLHRSRALAGRVVRLPHRLQVAFAAGCAERVLPVLEYDGFAGGPDFLPAFRVAVEAVWAAATGSPADLTAARAAVEAVFPAGDHYAGYDGTVGAGVAVLRAVDAAGDPSGQAASDAALHASSVWEQLSQWDDEPTDDLDWQEQALERLERLGDQPCDRRVFDGLPAPRRLGAG
jgi:hypothetical protein